MNLPDKKFLLLTCFLLTLLCLWMQQGMFSRDGVVFMNLALKMCQGDWATVFWHPQHPLTGGVIALLMHLRMTPELAGHVMGLMSVGLVLLAVMRLARQLYSESVSRLAGLLVICNPFVILMGADILSDGLYWAFLLWALSWGVSAFKMQNHNHAVFAGACLGLAYLTRPEGLVMAGLLLPFWVAVCLKSRQSLKGPLLSLVALVLVMSPYVMALHNTTGEWRLSLKMNFMAKSGLTHFVTADARGRELFDPQMDPKNPSADPFDESPSSEVSYVGRYIEDLPLGLIKLLWPLIALLAISKWVLKTSSRGLLRDSWPLLIASISVLLILHLKWLDVHYLSFRHLIPLSLFLTPLGAVGLKHVHERMKPRLFTCLVVLALLVTAAKSSKFYQGHEKRAETFKVDIKLSGQQLAGQEHRYLMATDTRLAWFAGNLHFVEQPLSLDVARYAQEFEQKWGPDLVVVINSRRPHQKDDMVSLRQKFLKAGWQETALQGDYVSFSRPD